MTRPSTVEELTPEQMIDRVDHGLAEMQAFVEGVPGLAQVVERLRREKAQGDDA